MQIIPKKNTNNKKLGPYVKNTECSRGRDLPLTGDGEKLTATDKQPTPCVLSAFRGCSKQTESEKRSWEVFFPEEF